MSQRKILTLLAIVLLPILCRANPNEAEAKALVLQKARQESGGLIQVNTFTKTNGLEREIFGQKLYIMEYDAELEFLADCIWSGPSADHSFTGEFLAKQGPMDPGNYLSGFHTKAKKGQKLKVSGAAAFEKTEKGWRLFRENGLQGSPNPTAPAPPEAEPSQYPKLLIGGWNRHAEFIEYFPNGTYVNHPRRGNDEPGKWRLKGSVLTHTPNTGKAYSNNIRQLSKSRMVMTISGTENEVEYTRAE